MERVDKRLLEKFRRGDADAFDQLYQRTAKRVYRLAFRMLGSQEDAEDVTALTFGEVYRNRMKFAGHSAIETWMYRITIHMVHRQLRQKKQTSQLEDRMFDPRSEGDIRGIEIDQLLSALPDRIRVPFLLVRVEGLSYKEAAEVLERKIGTVQSQVHEASQLLRGRLNAATAAPYLRTQEEFLA